MESYQSPLQNSFRSLRTPAWEEKANVGLCKPLPSSSGSLSLGQQRNSNQTLECHMYNSILTSQTLGLFFSSSTLPWKTGARNSVLGTRLVLTQQAQGRLMPHGIFGYLPAPMKFPYVTTPWLNFSGRHVSPSLSDSIPGQKSSCGAYIVHF